MKERGHAEGIPALTLWENLQLSVPHTIWEDFVREDHVALRHLVPLLKDPYKSATDATAWECFLVSLMKGIFEPTPHLLVDMQEDIFPTLLLKTLKSALMKSSSEKIVYLSSGTPSLWLDCAHHLVRKNGYEFVFEALDSESIKRHWAA